MVKRAENINVHSAMERTTTRLFPGFAITVLAAILRITFLLLTIGPFMRFSFAMSAPLYLR